MLLGQGWESVIACLPVMLLLCCSAHPVVATLAGTSAAWRLPGTQLHRQMDPAGLVRWRVRRLCRSFRSLQVAETSHSGCCLQSAAAALRLLRPAMPVAEIPRSGCCLQSAAAALRLLLPGKRGCC